MAGVLCDLPGVFTTEFDSGWFDFEKCVVDFEGLPLILFRKTLWRGLIYESSRSTLLTAFMRYRGAFILALT